MILTDKDILDEIAIGGIDITPFSRKRLGSNSYDVTLGNILGMYLGTTLDAKEDNSFKTFKFGERFKLTPNRIFLGVTNEFISTSKFVPMLEGCSSIGRLGISIHATAGFGDIGFGGNWTLELSCIEPVYIYPNMVIGQIYFLQPRGECLVPYDKKPDSRYNMQPNVPVPSKSWKRFL